MVNARALKKLSRGASDQASACISHTYNATHSTQHTRGNANDQDLLNRRRVRSVRPGRRFRPAASRSDRRVIPVSFTRTIERRRPWSAPLLLSERICACVEKFSVQCIRRKQPPHPLVNSTATSFKGKYNVQDVQPQRRDRRVCTDLRCTALASRSDRRLTATHDALTPSADLSRGPRFCLRAQLCAFAYESCAKKNAPPASDLSKRSISSSTPATPAQEPNMKKFLALVAATVLFAPAAYAALYQAALIAA